jgi:hypothetical protein
MLNLCEYTCIDHLTRIRNKWHNASSAIFDWICGL